MRAQGLRGTLLVPTLTPLSFRSICRTPDGPGMHLGSYAISFSTVLSGVPPICLGPTLRGPAVPLRGRGHIRASPTTQYWSSILLLRGSSSSELSKEEGERGGSSPPPGQLCGGWPPQGPIHPRSTHKAQSEQHRGGTSERRKKQEGQRGRRKGRVARQEGRRRRGGTEQGRGKTHGFWHTSLSQGVGAGTAEGQARLPPTYRLQPAPTVTAAPHSEWFWPSNHHQPEERSPEPGFALQHLITWWQTHCPARLACLLSTEGAGAQARNRAKRRPTE